MITTIKIIILVTLILATLGLGVFSLPLGAIATVVTVLYASLAFF